MVIGAKLQFYHLDVRQWRVCRLRSQLLQLSFSFVSARSPCRSLPPAEANLDGRSLPNLPLKLDCYIFSSRLSSTCTRCKSMEPAPDVTVVQFVRFRADDRCLADPSLFQAVRNIAQGWQ
jgi:hypothetical protein